MAIATRVTVAAGRLAVRPETASGAIVPVNSLRHLSILALVVGQAVPAFAAGDAREGHALARQWCSECHVVDDDQTTGSADVPPFAAIARSESLTPEGLAAFLADPHPVMPNLSLSRAQIADLVAYIEGLRAD